jgi:amino acid efflux transporter
MSTSPARSLPLSVPRASALYIGALFGPGLLLLPGLAAQQAGPASIIAWVALLGLSAIFATVFAALGKAVPGAAGAAGYAAAGLGRRAAAMTRWWFLAGVIAGAPIVCLIGASYVTALTGAGIGQSPLARAAVAAGLLLAVLGLALGGVRASTMAQLLLVALLIAVVVTAVAGSTPAARSANWTPFAPHGWLSVGRAAATLMLSFVGWEAVAPLTGRLRAGQLSRVIGIAFTVTAVLYLGLAVATVSCLGRGADLTVPLADLLQLAIGPAGRAVAAAAALVLTAGSVNAYISGATEMLRELTAVPSQNRPNGPGRPPRLSAHALLGIIALAGLLLIGLSALRLADIIALVSVPTAMFLCVYLSCTASAVRILAGPVRVAAAVAVLAVLAVLAFCSWPALLAVAVVAAIAALATPSQRRLVGYSPAAAGMVRRTVSSSSPRSSTARTVLRPSRFSSCKARPVLLTTSSPSSEISRSPRSMPASCPELPAATAVTSSPARSDRPTAWRRARASRAGSSVRPSDAATSALPDSNEDRSRRSRPASTSRSAGDSADSSRSSLARCTGATRSNNSRPLPVSWTSEPRALAGSGSRVTIPLFSSRSSRTDTVPEVRPSASISRACGIRYGGPPRRRLTMTRKSAEVRPNLANTPASSASR